jgi:sec-independent protein translocase protein TatC
MALVPFPSKSAGEDPDWEDEESESSQGKMSFLEHLDELRRRIIYSLLSLVVGIIIACFFLGEGSWRGPILPQGLYNFVMVPMQEALGPNAKMIFTEPTEGMMLYIRIALIAGLLIAIPAIMTQVWLFVAPGLYANEKRLALPFVLMASVFFIAGAAFAHEIVFPLTWKFFGSFANEYVDFVPRIEPAFSLYMKLVLIFGAIFQLPTLVLFLAKMGVITARFLLRNMGYAILIIFIVGAVLSPGGDPMGQLLMAVPMFILYCISIVLAWLFGKKTKRLEEAS